MSAEEAIIDDGDAPEVSPLRLALLHTAFYVVALVATLALRSPPWLLLTLLYCGCKRGPLLGRGAHPAWMWSFLWAFVLLSAICCIGANVLTILVRTDAIQQTVWQQLLPLWCVVGVQQWRGEAWLDTIVAPAVVTTLFGVAVFYMRHEAKSGRLLRVRRGDTAASSEAFYSSTLLVRWPRVAVASRLAAPALLAAFAWAVASASPPSAVGLWLEAATFVFVGAALFALHRARLARLGSSSSTSLSASSASATAAHVVNVICGAAAALLVVCVCVSHNAVFAPLSATYNDLFTQLGLGHVELQTLRGLCRALQLVGVTLVVAGLAAVDALVMPSCAAASSRLERQNLLVVEEQEEEGDAVEESGERGRDNGVGRQPNDPPTPRADVGQELPSEQLQSTHLVQQAIAIACVMALLLYAVYFPSLISLPLWLTHLCCCAGGLVRQPLRPTSTLWWTLAFCLIALACCVVAQYACLVLLVNSSTAARAWGPALPCSPADDGGGDCGGRGAVVAQLIGEHAVALLIGLYLCARGTRDGPENEVSSVPPVVQAGSTSPPQPPPGEAETAGDAADDGRAYTTWMSTQLRRCAGDAKELRKVFETAVGRSPRTRELDGLVASAAASPTIAVARRLTVPEVYIYVASAPLYTYAIVISLFVLGTSGTAMDSLHALCLVLSLLFSTVGSNAVLYRRLRTLPIVWVAIAVGLQLGCRVLAIRDPVPSPAPTTSTTVDPDAPLGFAQWENYVGIAALEWADATPYFAVQLVLLWCHRYEPCFFVDWTRVWQCLVFRCRWAHVFRLVHTAAGFGVLLWIVMVLPRSVNVTVLVLLLFSAALLHHAKLHGLAYVWRRFLIVGYCGVVLLGMLLVQFSPMQPQLRHFLRALGCPAGAEGACARDVGLPSSATVWLTPLALPWWFVIVLATAAGTPYALPTISMAPVFSPTSRAASVAGAVASWWSGAQATVVTVVLLMCMTYAALRHPSLLTAAYLVGPVAGVYPTWTLCTAAVHAALQCTYQFWFSPRWLDTVTLWGTPVAQLLGLWRASYGLQFSSAFAISTTTHAPEPLPVSSTLAVAAAPLIIGLLQALQQHQLSRADSELTRSLSSRTFPSNRYSFPSSSSASTSFVAPALWRLCASHLYMLLLLILLHCTQRCALGVVVATLVVTVWWTADLRECGVLLRPRWLYRLCAALTAVCAVLLYLLHWANARFPQWPAHQRYPWLMGTADATRLTMACCTAAVACVALQRSSGLASEEGGEGDREVVLRHPHSSNFVWWLRQRIDRHRGTYGIRGAKSIRDFTPRQRDALLADAAELVDGGGEATERRREDGEADTSPSDERAALVRVDDATVCAAHPWSGLAVEVARHVPIVACGFVVAGAVSSSPSLLSVSLLLTGLLMALRHARLQWSFWRWWRALLLSSAVLPLSALFFGCTAVHDAVVALPPWVGLLVGFSTDGGVHVSGEGLRFTSRHVTLFFLLWLQGCLYNNPQWGLRLLRRQYAEKVRGEQRHAALQRQLVAQVTHAMAEATRVDCEIRAYLDGLRAGDDVAEVHISTDSTRDAPAPVEEEEEESEWRRLSSDLDAEMHPRRSSLVAAPASRPNASPRSPFLPVITVAAAPSEEREEDAAETTAEAVAAAPALMSSHRESPLGSPTWRWWRQRCERVLRSTTNALATYTYHPCEYRVSSFSATSAGSKEPLTHLLGRLLLAAVQVALRHTPLALLACAVANALVTGCLCELLGLCYVVQVALAYHPHAPRAVYQCFGVYVLAAVALKQLLMLWVTYDTTNPIPFGVAGTLLPLRRKGGNAWATAAASRESLHYDSLWVDILTLAAVVLHDRVCVIHGVYVDEAEPGGVPPAASARTPPAVASAEATSGAGRSLSPADRPVLSRTPSPPPPSTPVVESARGVRGAVRVYCANVVSVPGVGEDWYIAYTSVDLLALLVLALTYSRMTANEKLTLQDNVQNNQLPGPMALLLCMSVLQLVVDRMFYVQRCMRLKAVANWACALIYCLLYWWWRTNVAVSARAAGNAYFTLKMVALVLSVTQVCRGYPRHRQRDAFTTHPGSLFRYSCFMVYRTIPFLWEVRTLIDWTVQHTALTLQEYLTLEDVYVYLYHCRERYVGKQADGAKVGDAVPLTMKWLFGVSRLALVLLALLGPLLYYSTYNPSTVVNRATQLNLGLSFFGAHDFFATTVHDDASTPEGWWTWLARTRPTVALYGQSATEQTVQLMEFTSCSGSQWMASPQAMRQILTGLRAAADNNDTNDEDAEGRSAAYILLSMETTRGASSAAGSTAVSAANRWRIPKDTAQAMVRILEKETGATTTTTSTTTTTTGAPHNTSSSSSSSNGGSENGFGGGDDASSSSSDITSAVLPFFYSPFFFNRASRLDVLPTDQAFPNRNRQHCTLELHHERDVALNTLVRYWCLRCAPLFPAGNVPSEKTSSAAEWRCLTTGEGCEAFNYEDAKESRGLRRKAGHRAASPGPEVPIYMVVLSDSVVVGISILKGIGIVALYTTFVLALGRLLRSVLANKVGTLVFENMANPAVLENMVRCIGIAREYGDLRLEHTIYLELIDLLRSPERLFEVTGSLRCMYVDAGQDDLFRLGQVRRRGVRRDAEESGADVSTAR